MGRLKNLSLLASLALRNVMRYRRRSALSLAAIAVSVLLMVVVQSLINGLEDMLTEQIVLGQTGALQVHKAGFVANVNRPPLAFAFALEGVLEKVQATPGVSAAAARITFPAMLSVGDKTVISPGQAIDPAREYAVCPVKQNDIRQGGGVSAGGGVISPALQKQLGVTQGDEIVLLAPDVDGVLNAANMKVAGLLADIPVLTTNKKLAYVPLDLAQEVLRMPGQALEIAVAARDYHATAEVARALGERLGPAFEVHTWQERSKSLLDTIEQRRRIFNFITQVFLLVALLGVANTMLMSVLGRTREIGMMMAVGMRRRHIARLFVAEAATIGAFGSLIGALFGVALVFVMHRRGITLHVPGSVIPYVLRPVIAPAVVARGAIIVCVGSALAALYPARRASRMSPIQAMGAL